MPLCRAVVSSWETLPLPVLMKQEAPLARNEGSLQLTASRNLKPAVQKVEDLNSIYNPVNLESRPLPS